jgi:hypothetical protein
MADLELIFRTTYSAPANNMPAIAVNNKKTATQYCH